MSVVIKGHTFGELKFGGASRVDCVYLDDYSWCTKWKQWCSHRPKCTLKKWVPLDNAVRMSCDEIKR